MSGPMLYDSIKCVEYPFGDKTQFKIGRNENCSLDIASKFISRNQCIIELNEEKEWVIKDLSSFKTTLVKNKKVGSSGQMLQDGDKITFLHYKDSEFIFYKNSFNDNPGIKKRKLGHKSQVLQVDCSDEEEEPPEKRRCKIKDNNDLTELSSENKALASERDRLVLENKNLNEKYLQISKILEETQKSLEHEEAEKTNLALKLVDEEAVKSNLVIQLQNYIDQLKECELEKDRLVVEKNNCKEVRSNSNCDSVEFHQLKEDLECTRKELLAKEERLNEVLAEKDILSNNISDLLEQEFSCSVCSEVIYQAISLECRHTFCAKCLATWKLTKKECPVCRTKIRAEVNPLVIDQFLDKLTSLIGGEFKQRRQTVREERASNNRGTKVSPFRYPQTSRRGRRRSNNNNNGRSNSSRRNPLANVVAEYEMLVNQLHGLNRLVDESPVLIDLTGNSRYGSGRR